MSEHTDPRERVWTALHCLYIEAPKEVADDLRDKVVALVTLLEGQRDELRMALRQCVNAKTPRDRTHANECGRTALANTAPCAEKPIPTIKYSKCGKCKGYGEIIKYDEGMVMGKYWLTCPACGGTGKKVQAGFNATNPPGFQPTSNE